MRTACVFFMAALCLLIGGQHARAKVCDEVLYVAYRGSGLRDNVLYFSYTGKAVEIRYTEKWNDKTIKVPHYLGAVCVDNVAKKLEFYPRDEDFPFNANAEHVVRE